MLTEIDGCQFDVKRIRAQLEVLRNQLVAPDARTNLLMADRLIGALLKERLPPQAFDPCGTPRIPLDPVQCSCGIPKKRCPKHKHDEVHGL